MVLDTLNIRVSIHNPHITLEYKDNLPFALDTLFKILDFFRVEETIQKGDYKGSIYLWKTSKTTQKLCPSNKIEIVKLWEKNNNVHSKK